MESRCVRILHLPIHPHTDACMTALGRQDETAGHWRTPLRSPSLLYSLAPTTRSQASCLLWMAMPCSSCHPLTLTLSLVDEFRLHNTAACMTGLGRWDEAAPYYQRAVQLAPEFSFAAANFALAQYQVCMFWKGRQ